jgi:hypothetical protein
VTPALPSFEIRNVQDWGMKPTITYRPADNAAYIRLSEAKVLESAEVSPDVVFDYDS